ncbi:unnamed protein product [Cunninghamella blakesleeana]
MLLYKDILTGDELFSDAYQMEVIMDVYVVDCIPKANSKNDNNNIEEGLIQKFQLQPTTFDKETYSKYIAFYTKNLETKLREIGKNDNDISEYYARFNPPYEYILDHLNEFQFYTGKSKNPDGTVGLLNHRGDGSAYFTFYMDGIEAIEL